MGDKSIVEALILQPLSLLLKGCELELVLCHAPSSSFHLSMKAVGMG
jgi:hypothetical protein